MFNFGHSQLYNFVLKVLIKVSLPLDAQLDWMKEAALCIDFLNDACILNEKCTLQHNLYKTPYLWQYKDLYGTSWANFDKDTNENIERAFCDPSKLVSDRNFPPLQIRFTKIPSISKTHFTNDKSSMVYRRLSTHSSVMYNKSAKQSVTHWKWYWEKSTNVWEEYKIWVGYFCLLFLHNIYLKKVMSLLEVKNIWNYSVVELIEKNDKNIIKNTFFIH